MPGLQARPPVRSMLEATDSRLSNTLMFLSFCFSLPSPLSLSKKLIKSFFNGNVGVQSNSHFAYKELFLPVLSPESAR